MNRRGWAFANLPVNFPCDPWLSLELEWAGTYLRGCWGMGVLWRMFPGRVIWVGKACPIREHHYLSWGFKQKKKKEQVSSEWSQCPLPLSSSYLPWHEEVPLPPAPTTMVSCPNTCGQVTRDWNPKTMSQNNFSLLFLSCLCWVFCHSDEKR